MKRILSLCCVALAIQASSITTYAPSSVKKVYRDHHGFSIQDECGMRPVKDYFVAKELLNSSPAVLKKMQEHGYIKASRLSNGEYKLDYCARGRGGGPIAAGIAYWVVKVGLYSAITGAVVGAATVTAGAAGGVMATGAVAGSAAAASATGGAAAAGMATAGLGGMAAAGAGAGVMGVATGASASLAAGIATSAAATEVVSLGVGAAVAGAAPGVGAVAAITGTVEAASAGAALFFLSIPFLP